MHIIGKTVHYSILTPVVMHRSSKTVNQCTPVAVGIAHIWQNRVFFILARVTSAYFPLLWPPRLTEFVHDRAPCDPHKPQDAVFHITRRIKQQQSSHGATPEQDPSIDLPQPSLRSDIGAGASRVRRSGISPPQDDQVMRNPAGSVYLFIVQ